MADTQRILQLIEDQIPSSPPAPPRSTSAARIRNVLSGLVEWIIDNNTSESVKSLIDLKSREGTPNSQINLLGYFMPGDGGSGSLFWDPDSVEAENGGTIYQVPGLTKGRYKRNFQTIELKYFGAKGDGVTDDSDAIQLAVNYCTTYKYQLHVGLGSYYVGKTVNVNGGIYMFGDGCATTTQKGNSRFITKLNNIPMFIFNNSGGKINLDNISWENESTDLAVAGSVGMRFMNADSAYFCQVSVINFYNNVEIHRGIYYNFNGFYCFDPVNIGCWLRNTNNADIGDMSFNQSYFVLNYFTNRSATAAIKWQSGGGLRVQNSKINYSGNQGKWKYGIEFQPEANSHTSVIVITGNSIENCSSYGIYFHNDGVTTATLSKIVIAKNEFMVGNAALRVSMTNAAGNADSRFLTGLLFQGNKTDGQYGCLVDGATSVNVSGNEFNVLLGTVLFGSSCYGCVQTNNLLNPLGYNVTVYQNGQTDTSTTYGTEDLKFDRHIPYGATPSTYVKLFDVSLLQNFRNCKLTLDIDAMADGVGCTYVTQTRLMSLGSGSNLTLTPIGADFASVANLIDIDYQINAAAKLVSIRLKLNSNASAATALHGKVTLKIDGRVYKVVQY